MLSLWRIHWSVPLVKSTRSSTYVIQINPSSTFNNTLDRARRSTLGPRPRVKNSTNPSPVHPTRNPFPNVLQTTQYPTLHLPNKPSSSVLAETTTLYILILQLENVLGLEVSFFMACQPLGSLRERLLNLLEIMTRRV